MREIEAICLMKACDSDIKPLNEEHVPTNSACLSNDDDLQIPAAGISVSAVSRRNNVLSKQEYCARMRLSNEKQRELILEVIHRLHERNREPIQIFLTGPAGCGKTFTLKALQLTYNRYSQQHNALNNAYIATATTGKAAVGIDGMTVHTAFHLNFSRQADPLKPELLQSYRLALRNVECVIIDEISMCSSHLFNLVDARLQSMTGNQVTFGGLDLIACGDLKQLPPVDATPVYATSNKSIGGNALLRQSLDYFPSAKSCVKAT